MNTTLYEPKTMTQGQQASTCKLQTAKCSASWCARWRVQLLLRVLRLLPTRELAGVAIPLMGGSCKQIGQ